MPLKISDIIAAQSDAGDYSDKYNTALSPQDEVKYQEWAKANKKEKDTYDYDMRGWWKENGGAQNTDARGHFSDTYKKPNHPTFSEESKYSGGKEGKGGKWIQHPGSQDQWDYQASEANLKHQTLQQLEDYFKRVEPGSKVLPPSAR